MVEPGFESSLDPSLDSEGEGLSRVWTQAYNWTLAQFPCLLYITPLSRLVEQMPGKLQPGLSEVRLAAAMDNLGR